jgi:hypothetical protein
MEFQETETYARCNPPGMAIGQGKALSRRGRVHRHDGFDASIGEAAQIVHHAAAITGLLARAGSAVGLTDGVRLTLITLVEMVHSERWRAGSPALWSSNATIATARGIEVRTVQRHLSALEASGWLIRRYTKTHHRAGEGCIDLAPLTYRLAELREAILEADMARRERRMEDEETSSFGARPWGDDKSVTLNTDIQSQNLSSERRRVPAQEREVATSVTAEVETVVSGEAKAVTPAPVRFELALSLMKSALAAAAADPDGYLDLYPTSDESELATAVAALAKRRGVAASWIDQAYPRHGRLGVAARLVAALTLPGAKSVPGLARWMLGTDHRVDPWASIYARARS